MPRYLRFLWPHMCVCGCSYANQVLRWVRSLVWFWLGLDGMIGWLAVLWPSGLNRAFVWQLMSRIIEITYLKSSANCRDADSDAEPLERDLDHHSWDLENPLFPGSTYAGACMVVYPCNPCIIETKRNLFLQFVAASEIPFSVCFHFPKKISAFCLSQRFAQRICSHMRTSCGFLVYFSSA